MIHVWVHRIDSDRFPGQQGWRWCVGVSPDPTDPRFWLNAGHGDTEHDAAIAGETAGVTAVRALLVAGVVAERRTVRLEVDPCPPDSAISIE